MRRLVIFTLVLFVLAGCSQLTPPVARVRPVTDVYHGVQVVDEYRWLEDFSSPDVQSWSNGQNAYARNVLNNLPSLGKIRARVREIENATSVRYYSLSYQGGRLFAVKSNPAFEQPMLVVMNSAYEPESEQVIVDLNKFDSTASTSMDWFKPSPSGDLVAVSLSVGGTESGDVHIYKVSTGIQSDHVIERVNGGTAGGDLAWTPDGKAFFYTRYPRPPERTGEDINFYQQVWFHKLGTDPIRDTYEIGKDFPRIAEIQLDPEKNSGRVLATVQYGDGGEFAHYLRNTDGGWRQITDYADRHLQVIFAPCDRLFIASRSGAPMGKVLRMPIDGSVEDADVVVPEGKDTVVSSFGVSNILATDSSLYVTYQLGGPSEIRVFDFEGNQKTSPSILPVSSVGGLIKLSNNDILFNNSSYIEPSASYEFKAKDGSTQKTALFTKPAVDFSDCKVVRDFALSKDGTKVPVNIICRKDIVLDGSNPTLLTGYGGYGISQTPRFLGTNRIWIEQGGVYAIANLRGGGEYGEKWHQQGMLTNKQNVFDDFAAAMQYMIDKGYTCPEKLTIKGGSNGGLLMGAMITQHPQLCESVIASVGIYDMLRVELAPNGQFNIPEFGTVKKPDHFKAMYAYSPFHNVKRGTACPAVLFLTGANDPRVDPMQSRKMTAKLQAAAVSNKPILLRTSSGTGHGSGTPLSERIEQTTHIYAFLFDTMNLDYKPVR